MGQIMPSSRDTDILIERTKRLVFGICAQIEGQNGERVTRVGGSGIFVAPFQALTARHVTRELFHTDPTRGDELNRRARSVEENGGAVYFETPHSSLLYQLKDATSPRPLLWHVRYTWDSSVTDISLMEVYAEGDEAAGRQHSIGGFFELRLLPPPVDSHVIMLGYPLANVESNNGVMSLDLRYVSQEGRVTDVYETFRDRGMYSFPCFRIDNPVNHGFSGGPVFWDGKLCGIVSGGSENDTYAASLWPLSLMEYQYPNPGLLGGTQTFRALFDSGALCLQDWPQIRERVTRRYHEDGKPYAYLEAGP
jgi:hypothetical protein